MSLSTNITLTVSNYNIKLSRNLKFYENDQLKLIFTLKYFGIDNANGAKQKIPMPLNALSAILFIETPLGVDSIESATIEENVVTFYLTSNQTRHIGVSRMQIQLSDADGCQITLPPMEFEVRKNIYDNEVILSQVLLADEDKKIIVDENSNAINTGTQVSSQTYPIALSAEDETTATTSQPTKQIKDFNLKTGASGEEDLLIQDSDGVTKRIKASEFLNVNVDLILYYTKEEVNALLNNKADISHTHTVADIEDMPDYALKTDIPTVPTKTSELTNDTGFITTIPTEYITESELNTELSTKANISDIPSLDGYATETFVTNKIAEASLGGGEVDLSEYATKDELNTKANISHTHTVSEITNLVIPTVDVDKNYVDTQLATKANIEDIPNLDGYALKSEIPTVPTKTSELANDSGFITTIPTEYVTENEINAKGYLTEHQDISMKADKTELHTHDNKTVLDSITETKITEWNNKSDFDGNYNSLTNKPNIPTVDVNKNYVDTQLATKANKSEIPSLDGYATETYVQNKIAEAALSGGEVDLSGLATKDELATKADISSIPTKTSQLTNDKGYLTSVPSEYVTETELNDKGYLTSHQDISGKANKTYVDEELDKKSDKTHNHDKVYAPIEHEHSQYLTSVPSEYVTDEELNAKGYLTSHQDISGKADKLYVDTELAKKSDKTHTHSYNNLTDKPTIPSIDNLATKEELTDGLATKANVSHTHDQYLTEQELSDYALKTEIPTVPTKTSQLTNDSGFINSIPSEYITETELNEKGYLTEHQDISNLATKAEVQTKADVNHIHSQYLTSIPTEYITETELADALSTKANTSDIPSLEGYATETYVTNKIAEASLSGSDVDLSGYATKDELTVGLAKKSNVEHIHSYNDLTNKPTIPSVEGLASTEYVDNAVSNITIDTSNLATKDELNTKANSVHTHISSDITGLSIVATSGDYNDLLKKPVIPTVDVNKEYVDAQLSTKANISDIPDLTGYALKTEIPSVPTNTSELVNDSGFLTSVPNEYITETELSAKGYLVSSDIAGKANISDLSSVATTGDYNDLLNKPNVTNGKDGENGATFTPNVDTDGNLSWTNDKELENPTTINIKGAKGDKGEQGIQGDKGDKGEPGEKGVDGKDGQDGLTTSISLNGTVYSHVDGTITLPDYPTIPTKTSQLNNDSGFITSVPSEYITESELDAKGYLTEHQDITGKANISDLSDVATSGNYNDLINKPTIPSIDGLATETYVNDKITPKLTGNSTTDKTLTLTVDKYQYAVLSNGDSIVLPSVSSFTEIHLFFKADTDLTITFPSVRWQTIPSITSGHTYEIIFTYVVDEWLAGVICYE